MAGKSTVGRPLACRVREADPVNNVELRRDRHGHESVVFSFPYVREVVDAVRAIPGRRFDWDRKEWGRCRPTAPRPTSRA